MHWRANNASMVKKSKFLPYVLWVPWLASESTSSTKTIKYRNKSALFLKMKIKALKMSIQKMNIGSFWSHKRQLFQTQPHLAHLMHHRLQLTLKPVRLWSFREERLSSIVMAVAHHNFSNHKTIKHKQMWWRHQARSNYKRLEKCQRAKLALFSLVI